MNAQILYQIAGFLQTLTNSTLPEETRKKAEADLISKLRNVYGILQQCQAQSKYVAEAHRQAILTTVMEYSGKLVLILIAMVIIAIFVFVFAILIIGLVQQLLLLCARKCATLRRCLPNRVLECLLLAENSAAEDDQKRSTVQVIKVNKKLSSIEPV